MPLTTTERRILIGPAVVGTVFGGLAALALGGLHSEYGHNLEPLYFGISSWAVEALLTFVIVTSATVLVFGIVPLLIKRFASRRARGPDA
jgi:hypothetical protein